jgi:hypothetical protein
MRVFHLSIVAHAESDTAKVETDATVPVVPKVSVSRATRPQGRSVLYAFETHSVVYLLFI